MNYIAATFAGIVCCPQQLSSFTLFSCSLNSNLSGFGTIRNKRKFRKSLQLFNKFISITSLLFLFLCHLCIHQNVLVWVFKNVYLLCKYLLFFFYCFISHTSLALTRQIILKSNVLKLFTVGLQNTFLKTAKHSQYTKSLCYLLSDQTPCFVQA